MIVSTGGELPGQAWRSGNCKTTERWSARFAIGPVRRGREKMRRLKYGNTNTFFVQGSKSSLLVDTDYAGTLTAFYRALKQNDIKIKDIDYVMATHYHPDHMGLIGELMEQGVKLILLDVQRSAVHFSDPIFARDRIARVPIDETRAIVLSCEESRDFLHGMGISGEILHTPSHSADSVSLVLDDGECLVGDLGLFEYLEAYQDPQLQSDWASIRSFHPRCVHYAHAPERVLR